MSYHWGVFLGQLSDLMSNEAWTVVYAIGLASPLIGQIVAWCRFGDAANRRLWFVGGFYAMALSFGSLAYSGTEQPVIVCTFLILLPVGFVLGVLVATVPIRTE
jgi:hypothetical protein